MTTLQSKEFEWRRINAELYQLHARLSRATATRPEEVEQLRATIRNLDEASVKVQAEIERLREGRHP